MRDHQTGTDLDSITIDDNRYNFQLQDPSVDPDDFFILTVFSATRLELPNQLLWGSVLLIRDIWVSQIKLQ
jgi:hypothetical protein